MAGQDLSYQNPEQTLSEDVAGAFTFPWWIRLLGILLLGGLLIASLWIFFSFIVNPESTVSPSDLGITNLIVFCVLGLIVILSPWENYGLRLRKFGPFEFEEILATQATEHAVELQDLRDRIDQLEQNAGQIVDGRFIDNGSDAAGKEPQSSNRREQLSDRLVSFLRDWNRYAFSPLRIEKWGAQQPGYGDIEKYSSAEIRAVLQSLVAKGQVETTISRKGNTLYRYPR